MGLREELQQVIDKYAPKTINNIRPCQYHSGDGCEMCGGVGYIKRCNLNQCINHGCCGDGLCIPDKNEVDAYKRSIL